MVNQCNINNGGCQHICDDSRGRGLCRCRQGYRLNPDGRTCEGEFIFPKLRKEKYNQI